MQAGTISLQSQVISLFIHKTAEAFKKSKSAWRRVNQSACERKRWKGSCLWLKTSVWKEIIQRIRQQPNVEMKTLLAAWLLIFTPKHTESASPAVCGSPRDSGVIAVPACWIFVSVRVIGVSLFCSATWRLCKVVFIDDLILSAFAHPVWNKC